MRGAEMKRWVLRIAVLLALGAIVNVAAAWGCVLVGTLQQTAISADPSEWEWLSARGWSPLPDTSVITHRNEVRLFEGRGVVLHCYYEREEAIDVSRGPSFLHVASSAQSTSAGWPLLSIVGEVMHPAMATRQDIRVSAVPYRMSDETPIVIGATGSGVFVPRSVIHGIEVGGRYLPLRPLWPGFAVNTVFYAVILWGLFAGPFVVRRWRRIRRGLCPKCAYDLRGTRGGAATACPECGCLHRHRNLVTST